MSLLSLTNKKKFSLKKKRDKIITSHSYGLALYQNFPIRRRRTLRRLGHHDSLVRRWGIPGGRRLRSLGLRGNPTWRRRARRRVPSGEPWRASAGAHRQRRSGRWRRPGPSHQRSKRGKSGGILCNFFLHFFFYHPAAYFPDGSASLRVRGYGDAPRKIGVHHTNVPVGRDVASITAGKGSWAGGEAAEAELAAVDKAQGAGGI